MLKDCNEQEKGRSEKIAKNIKEEQWDVANFLDLAMQMLVSVYW